MSEDTEQIRQSRDQALAELNKALETLGQVRSDLSAARDEIERLRVALGVSEKALDFYSYPWGKADSVPDFYSEMDFGDRAHEALTSIRSAQEPRDEEKDAPKEEIERLRTALGVAENAFDGIKLIALRAGGVGELSTPLSLSRIVRICISAKNRTKDLTSGGATCRPCAATIASDPPQDCNWPFCGCDPKANKVLDTLEECGYGDIGPLRSTQEPRAEEKDKNNG